MRFESVGFPAMTWSGMRLGGAHFDSRFAGRLRFSSVSRNVREDSDHLVVCVATVVPLLLEVALTQWGIGSMHCVAFGVLSATFIFLF